MIFDDFFIPPIISGIFIDEIKMSLPKDEIKNGHYCPDKIQDM